MRIPNIKHIISKLEADCVSKRKEIYESPVGKFVFNSIYGEKTILYSKEKTAQCEFDVKAAPICAWLKYPEVAREKRVFVTDFSRFNDLLVKSSLSLDEKLSLILHIISTNIENGILAPATKKDHHNILKMRVYKLRRKRNYNNEGNGLKDSIEWYKQRMNNINGIVPSALYDKIQDFRCVVAAHQLFRDKIKEFADVYNLTSEDLNSILIPLNVSEDLLTILMSHIRYHNSTQNALDEKDLSKPKSKSKETSQKYLAAADSELHAIRERDKQYTALEHFLQTYRYKPNNVLSFDDILKKYKSALDLGINSEYTELFLKNAFPPEQLKQTDMLNELFNYILGFIFSIKDDNAPKIYSLNSYIEKESFLKIFSEYLIM